MSKAFNETTRVYKEYTGLAGWLIISPCIILLVGLVLSDIVSFPTLVDDRSYQIFTTALLFISIILLLNLGALVLRTSLKVGPDGLTYENVKPFGRGFVAPLITTLTVPWEDVEEITKPNSASRTIRLKTRVGEVRFRMRGNPGLNEVIVQELVARAPKLRERVTSPPKTTASES